MLKKITAISLMIGICFTLPGCKEKKIQTNKTSPIVQNMPLYDITEYDLSPYISNVNSVMDCNDVISVTGTYSDNSSTVYEKKISDNSLVNTINVEDSYGELDGDYFNGVYYEGINMYSSDGKINPTSTDMFRPICRCTDEYGNTYVVTGNRNDYSIMIFDTLHQVSSIKKIENNDCFIEDIDVYDNKIYIGAFQLDIYGEQKVHTPFIYELDSEYKICNTISDIDILGLNGFIPQTDGSFIVYSYDDKTNMSYITKSDGDMSTFSQVINIDNQIKLFGSGTADTVYLFDGVDIYLFDLNTETKELKVRLSDLNKEAKDCKYNVLSCNNDTYTYIMISDFCAPVDIRIDTKNNINAADSTNAIYNIYEDIDEKNEPGLYAQNIITDEKICFNGVDIKYNKIYYTDDEFYIINQEGKIDVYDKKGSHLFTYKNDDYYVQAILIYGDREEVIYTENNNYYFAQLNKDSQKFENIISLENITPLDENTVFYPGNGDNLFYFVQKNYVYGYSKTDNICEAIADFCDLNSESGVYYIKKIDDGVYQVISGEKIFYLVKSDKSRKDIDTITIGNLTPQSMLPYLNLYPENNKEYEINVINYFEEEGNYEDRLSKDIISGNVPDILISNTHNDISQFENKGMLLNLNELIQKDETWNDSDYMMNIINLFKSDESLYRIPCGFQIDTLCVDEDIDPSEWNYDRFLKLWSENQTNYINKYCKTDLLNLFKLSYNRDFIDVDNSKTNFNSPDFINIITAINNYGIDNMGMNDEIEIYNDKDKIYKINSNTLYPGYSFDDLYTESSKMHICGYPSANGGKSYVYSDMCVSVSADTQKKDQCWDFIKRAIQKSSSNGFSVITSQFNDNVNKELRFNTSDEFVEEFLTVLNNVSEIVKLNQAIDEIISSQIESFFDGSSTAQDVAK